jgi:hypothetical protein
MSNRVTGDSRSWNAPDDVVNQHRSFGQAAAVRRDDMVRLAFNRTVVLRYRVHLELRGYAPTTINLRLW